MLDIRIDTWRRQAFIEVVRAEDFARVTGEIVPLVGLSESEVFDRRRAATDEAFAQSTRNAERPTQYTLSNGWILIGAAEKIDRDWRGRCAIFYLVQDPFGQNHVAVFEIPVDASRQLARHGRLVLPALLFEKSPFLVVEGAVEWWSYVQSYWDILARALWQGHRIVQAVRALSPWRQRAPARLASSPGRTQAGLARQVFR